MATEVLRTLNRHKSLRRFLAITCDNAANNKTLTSDLSAQLLLEGVRWEPLENTIPCLAHIINLMVQDIIKFLRLSAPEDIERAEALQHHHVQDISAELSVPNSLRKVCDKTM